MADFRKFGGLRGMPYALTSLRKAVQYFEPTYAVEFQTIINALDDLLERRAANTCFWGERWVQSRQERPAVNKPPADDNVLTLP
jgi:hypothetical protein